MSGNSREKERREKSRKSANGFSLVESVISLSLFLLVVLASFEFFGVTRDIFLRLQGKQESKEAALAALDRMKIDLLEAGSGLIAAQQLGLLEGIAESESTLLISSREKDLRPLADLIEGQTRVELESTTDIAKGREILLFAVSRGEVKTIASVDRSGIVLSSPLNFSYPEDEASLALLRRVSLFLDEKNGILRRKINSSPAQPLLEEVSFFEFRHERASNLVTLRLSLKSDKENIHEASVFPKNMALSSGR